jgi:hypothetical protein
MPGCSDDCITWEILPVHTCDLVAKTAKGCVVLIEDRETIETTSAEVKVVHFVSTLVLHLACEG